jgi:hypothetical protein
LWPGKHRGTVRRCPGPQPYQLCRLSASLEHAFGFVLPFLRGNDPPNFKPLEGAIATLPRPLRDRFRG